MRLNFKILFVFVFIAFISFSFQKKEQAKVANEINWMSWEEVQIAQQNEPRKVIVDVYTNWCTWCKQMDKETFQNEKIVAYINENYYAVKFDAEYRETIIFKEKKYHYTKTGKRGYNELATSLLEGAMNFPNTVFLDENLDALTTVAGFLEPQEIDPMLSYFVSDAHLKQKWSQYMNVYKSIL